MPNTKSAKKRLRQNKVRNIRNKAGKTQLRSAIKKVRAATETADQSLAQSSLAGAISVIDKAAGKEIIPKNTASRYKSRLSRQTNALLRSS